MTTPLLSKLRDRIQREGALTVAQFMEACLTDSAHGYYRTRPAIGRAGDFITAPEISQVFGELVGLWAAVVWRQMGAPGRVRLVELGPGRGTLMRDALRAAGRVAGFRDALSVELVEISAPLRAVQQATLADAGAAIAWHETGGEAILSAGGGVPEPVILIANEVLDTMPVQQLVRHDGRWRLRGVGLDLKGALAFTLREDAVDPALVPPLLTSAAAEGDIFEFEDDGFLETAVALHAVAQEAPVAALFIDYGHARPALGDTLAAIRDHAPVSPLACPGEADLSHHVDFARFAATHGEGFAVDGPVSQAAFLGALGIVERGSRLMADNPASAARIEADVARLISPGGMGGRFHAIGLRSRELPPLPGLG